MGNLIRKQLPQLSDGEIELWNLWKCTNGGMKPTTSTKTGSTTHHSHNVNQKKNNKNTKKHTKASRKTQSVPKRHQLYLQHPPVSLWQGLHISWLMAETRFGAKLGLAAGPCYKSESSMVARALAGFSSSWYRPWLADACCLGKRSKFWCQSVFWGRRTYQQMKTFLKQHAKWRKCSVHSTTSVAVGFPHQWWDGRSEISSFQTLIDCHLVQFVPRRTISK